MQKYIIKNTEYIVNWKSIDKTDADIINKIISYLISVKYINSFNREDMNDKKWFNQI